MTDPLATALTARLGCRLPVIQTAMGWIATPQLVAASSNAGAFGFLAGAVMKPAELGEAIARLKDINAASARGELPFVPAGRRRDCRDHPCQCRPRPRGQLRTRAGREDDRPVPRCGDPVHPHRRRGEARREDGPAGV